MVGLELFVAVSYRIIGDTERHTTYRAYSLLEAIISDDITKGRSVDILKQWARAGEVN
jgi:hypothetical protein